MAERFPLTEGALQVIMAGGEIKDPVMQVLGSKKVLSGQRDKERFRILLSDGKFFISFAMLTTQINEKVGSGQLPDNSIIKVKRYITSIINNAGKGDKRVLVILDLELLVSGTEVDGKIGCPVSLPDSNVTQNSIKSDSEQSNGSVQQSSSNIVPVKNEPLNQSAQLQTQFTNPISGLSPYQNKWVIKARVSNKSAIRTWSNSKGEGKLFSMDLIDESGEIRATAFRDQVDKFYDFIEVDKVYYISKCQLKMANKQYSTINSDYEMTFTNDTVIQECTDDLTTIPQTIFNFTEIAKIAQIETGSLIDIIGVCKNVSDLLTFTAKSTGRELKKREITLVDKSQSSISLTLWGNDAEMFDGSTNPVVAIKAAKVGEFGGGKNISVLMSSILKINPDLPEAFALRGWYDNTGNQIEATNISAQSVMGGQTQWLNFNDVINRRLGHGEKGDYFQTMGTVLLIRSEKCTYKACPTEECNKKIIDLDNGMYKCEKCNREYPNFKYRLLCNVNIADSTGSQWMSMFSSEAEKLLGKTAKEVGELVEQDSDAIFSITDETLFKQFVFKCRIKTETYNDESRLKTVAVKIDPINYKEYNNYLLSSINQFMHN